MTLRQAVTLRRELQKLFHEIPYLEQDATYGWVTMDELSEVYERQRELCKLLNWRPVQNRGENRG